MRGRHLCLAAVAVALATWGITSCVQPYGTSEGVAVWVVADHLHAEILVQDEAPEGYRYTLYTFADREWYLEGNLEPWTGLRAVLLDTQAVVSTGTATSSDDVQEVLRGLGIGTELNGWRFMVPRDALDRAIDHVERMVIGEPGTVLESGTRRQFDVTYREAHRPYHVFYSCIQFVADFMNHSGVDFGPVWYYYTVSILRDRLNQLAPMKF